MKDAIEKFKLCGEKINKIKDNLHIILYFFNYNNERSFANLEFIIIFLFAGDSSERKRTKGI